MAGLIWEFIDTRVHAYLSAIRIDLDPPVAELKTFLHSLFLPESKNRAKQILDSLKTGRITVDTQALQIKIRADVDVGERPLTGTKTEVLSETEIARLTASWEVWDAYLVHMITSLGPHQLSADDRRRLLDTLLAIRYQFITALTAAAIEPDIIRRQFVNAWKNLRQKEDIQGICQNVSPDGPRHSLARKLFAAVCGQK